MRIMLLGSALVGLAACNRQADESERPAARQFEPTAPLHAAIPVSGKSMLPTMPEETHLTRIDIAAPYSTLARGDIVLFWDYHRAGFTLHRIVERQGNAWIVQGDNPATNARVDRPFLVPENYLGRYEGEWFDTLAPTTPAQQPVDQSVVDALGYGDLVLCRAAGDQAGSPYRVIARGDGHWWAKPTTSASDAPTALTKISPANYIGRVDLARAPTP